MVRPGGRRAQAARPATPRALTPRQGLSNIGDTLGVGARRRRGPAREREEIMKMRRVALRLGALALGAWALAAAVAGTGAAQTLPQLRASLESAATHERTIVIADYLAKLERASDGRLRTRLYHGAQLHKDVTVARALREGSIEMAVPAGAGLSSFVPDIDIIQLPMFYGQPLDRQHH